MNVQTRAASPGSRYLFAGILIVSLFFMWGVANHLNDILIKQFKKAFQLSDLRSGLVQSAFYLGYFLFAIPAAVFMQRFGYKSGVVLGLLLYATGAFLFYPAAEVREYTFFLFALLTIASGLAFLETAANPLVAVLGSPEGASFRLNFAQAFNPLGAIFGVVIGGNFIFSGIEHTAAEIAAMNHLERDAYLASEAVAVQGAYLVLGLVVLLWAVLVLCARFPVVHEQDEQNWEQAETPRFSGIWRFPRLLWGVFAQFCYVGAQVGIWSFFIRYAQHSLDGLAEKAAADYLAISLVGFLIGRFAGAAAMRFVDPVRLMVTMALLAAAFTLVAVMIGGGVGVAALMLSGFLMSIMFPTIFATGIHGLGRYTKYGSSLMVMAIIGGAVFPALMGYISDISSIHIAMAVPFACFMIVAVYAAVSSRLPVRYQGRT